MTVGDIYAGLVAPQLGGGAWHPFQSFLVAINEAQTILCAASGTLYEEDELTILKGNFMVDVLGALPLFRRILRCRAYYGNINVVPVRHILAMGQIPYGTPRMVAQLGPSSLMFYPRPDESLSVSIGYERYPRILTDESDVPEVPEAYHQALADYCVPRLAMLEGGAELKRCLGSMQKFMKAVESLKQEVISRGR